MTDEILFEQRGHAGFVTLNRPKALNALSHTMVRELATKLDEWEKDDSIRHVVITGAGEKAFCAGGDIRQVYNMKQEGKGGLSEFFREEYVLNARIKTYPKPYVALLDGIVMGGGVGVSAHGSHRVGTEFTHFAMPETAIGFFPDVGGSFVLSRMPNHIGTYCGLSAGRLGQADALATGILTHTIRRDQLADLEKALETAEDVNALLGDLYSDPGGAEIMDHADLIERVFSADSVAEVMKRLDAETSDWAKKAAEAIRAKSPTSVHIAFRQIREGAKLDFNGCMTLEYRIVREVLKGREFFEGVRAVLVDKDHAPKWQPDTLDKVDTKALEAYFEKPADGDIVLS